MTRESYYRLLFRAAAVWSWLVSSAYWLGDSFDEPLLRSALPRVQPRLVLDMAVLPTFLFGFAFWWVSRDLTRNRAIPAVGAVGSVLAFVSFVSRAATGDIPLTLLPASVVDLSFGVLCMEFLLWVRRMEHRQTPHGVS